ncbi:PREDICTED: transmembrane protein 45B-like [Priapulus caudatus]|uniref:Transmembrane protein 45B-like n=1 Tax=Priapulus caudatus TaxID=37621 RepID=A0ABM1EUM5_PRICU|nr:PREDICTED: transmembrane protein 45B-like [Priapulus caudatus]
MGTFMGHVIPGSFFLVFGTWWTSQIAYRYARAQARRGLPYRSSVTFPCPGCLRSVPVEAILKVVLCSIGIAGEVVTGFRDGKFVNYGNAQHSVMFLLFGLTGVVDVALHYHRGAPPGIDYAAGALAFTVEGLLFVQHLHGRTPLDRQLHELLYCTIFACAVSVVAEARRRRSAVAALSRAYFTLLQGSWFMQAAVVLYSPLPGAVPWAADDHTQMTMVTVIFAWHCVGVLVYMAAVYGAELTRLQARSDRAVHVKSFGGRMQMQI